MRLLLSQDIRAMPDGQQLLLVNSAPPIVCEKIRYWDVAPWRDWADPNPMEGDHPRDGAPAIRLRYKTGGKTL